VPAKQSEPVVVGVEFDSGPLAGLLHFDKRLEVKTR
jgi:hypothetical protein